MNLRSSQHFHHRRRQICYDGNKTIFILSR
jgi:hypothetical protein